MIKKKILVSFCLICILSFSNLVYASNIESLHTETEKTMTLNELSKALELQPGKVYLSMDILDYLTEQDFEVAHEELKAFVGSNENLSMDEINEKAANLLTSLNFLL